MTLIEQCKKANATLALLSTSEKDHAVAENIRSRSADLAEASVALISISASGTVLLDAGILKESQLIDCTKPRSHLMDMRQKLKDAPSAITSGRTFTNLRKSLDTYTQETSQLVNNRWKEYVSETSPKIDNKLLSQHRNTSFADTVVKIEHRFKESQKIAKVVPTNTLVFSQLKDIWSEIRDHLAILPQADDPEVQAFLIAVGSENGASISLLTDSVRTWLLQHQMIEDFSIRRLR